jgi:hypothetical protein
MFLLNQTVNTLGSHLFPLPDAIASSFFPLIAQQYANKSDTRGEQLSRGVLAWFEHFAAVREHNGNRSMLRYVVPNTAGSSGARNSHYNDWCTANLVTAQLLLETEASPNFIADLFM